MSWGLAFQNAVSSVGAGINKEKTMDEHTYVFNAGDADFQERVLIRSQEVPVLLDCDC